MLFILISTLAPTTVSAEEIGQVVEIQGEVWRIRGKAKPVVLRPNAWIQLGDELITGPASSAKILMEDDTVFDVFEGSQLHVKNYESSKALQERRKLAKIKKLKVKVKPKKIVYRLSIGGVKGIFPTDKFKHTPVQLESPDSTIEITGTTLFTQVTADRGEFSTSVLLTEGKAFIRPTISNQFKKQPVTPGTVFATDFASKLGHSLTTRKLAPTEMKSFTEKRTQDSQKFRRSILSGKRKFVLSPEMKKFYRQNTTGTAREKNVTRNKIKNVIKNSSNRAMNMNKHKKMKSFQNIAKAPKCTTKSVCVQSGPKRVQNAQGNFVWVNGCLKYQIQRLPTGCRP
jgi:hypothetical protein